MARQPKVLGLDRRTPLAAAGPKLLAPRLSEVVRFARRISRGGEPGDIHAMRVATRRLRVALALFPSTALEDLSKRAKRLQDALGSVRDLQVEAAWLASVAATHAIPESVVAERRRQLARRERALVGTLPGWRRGLPRAELARALGDLEGKLGGKRMRSALERRLDQVDGRMKALRRSLDAPSGHRTRIAVKKLRYLAELLEPAFPSATAPLLEALVKPQEHLGELQDSTGWATRWSREHQRRRGTSRVVAAELALRAAADMERARARVQQDARRWRTSGIAARVRSLLKD